MPSHSHSDVLLESYRPYFEKSLVLTGRYHSAVVRTPNSGVKAHEFESQLSHLQSISWDKLIA